jgi:hydroxymethylpyrimidine pyrophosphatase-like HAD family hydrolase
VLDRTVIRLVCIDVDGTLLGTGGVLPRVWAAIDRARAAGLRLALCSGRPAFGNTRALAERVEPRGWHVFQNGASILQPKRPRWPARRALSRSRPRPRRECPTPASST